MSVKQNYKIHFVQHDGKKMSKQSLYVTKREWKTVTMLLIAKVIIDF